MCSKLGLLIKSGFPIIYESSGKKNPVSEKPNDSIEKMMHDFIKNFICFETSTFKNIF